MFRASSAHLQEDTAVYMQHMVLPQFVVACQYTAWVRVLTLAAYRQATRNSHREWQYHMLYVYSYVHLKMSTWCSKHVEENSILLINNQCTMLVINYCLYTVYLFLTRNFSRHYSVNILHSLGTGQPAVVFCRSSDSFARPILSHHTTPTAFRVKTGSASVAAIQIFHESGSTRFCAMSCS